MNPEFNPIVENLSILINEWEPKLSELPMEVITQRQNNQQRTIKKIVGHMIDSASNNTHRFVHLQYQHSPLVFPNYASHGNNDKWIAIQNYQDENWNDLVQLWKYANLHVIHVIQNISDDKLAQEWIASPGRTVTLKIMVIDYLRHIQLHISEIEQLVNAN